MFVMAYYIIYKSIWLPFSRQRLRHDVTAGWYLGNSEKGDVGAGISRENGKSVNVETGNGSEGATGLYSEFA